MDALEEACTFSPLDANWGYRKIPVREEDRYKTTFTSHAGAYRIKRLPFGLKNAPATIQGAFDMVLSQYNWQSCLVYLDDVIIYSTNLEKYMQEVEAVLQALQKAGISLKLKTCECWKAIIKELGHITTSGHVGTCKAQVQALD